MLNKPKGEAVVIDQPSQTPLTQEQIEDYRATAVACRDSCHPKNPERDDFAFEVALCDMALALSAARRDAERNEADARRFAAWFSPDREDFTYSAILIHHDAMSPDLPDTLDSWREAIDRALSAIAKGGK